MRELVVFDFDFTIAKTSEHILVYSPRGELTVNNKKYRRLHPTEVQQFGIHEDEKIDENSFLEFYSLDINNTRLITAVTPYLYYYMNRPFNILTARPQSVAHDVYLFLETNGILTDNLTFTGLTSSFHYKKVNWICDKLKNDRFNKLILFEDNKRVIDDVQCIFNNVHTYYIQNFYNRTLITYLEKK
jgi:hypothetical protein